jgi:hypothetical protein
MARHRGGHKPFASKAQSRLFFASPQLRRFARKAEKSRGLRRRA